MADDPNLREVSLADAIKSGAVRVEGEGARLAELFDLLDDFSLMFPVVEPRKET